MLLKKTNNLGNKIGKSIATLLFFGLINCFIMAGFGYLTIDYNANLNSRAAALVLSIIMPLVLSLMTTNMSSFERLFKLGSGMLIYAIIVLFQIGIPLGFKSTLLIVIFLFETFLYFGKEILSTLNKDIK